MGQKLLRKLCMAAGLQVGKLWQIFSLLLPIAVTSAVSRNQQQLLIGHHLQPSNEVSFSMVLFQCLDWYTATLFGFGTIASHLGTQRLDPGLSAPSPVSVPYVSAFVRSPSSSPGCKVIWRLSGDLLACGAPI